MQIEHKQIVDSGNTVIYINVYVDDRYEFGKENFGKHEADKSIKKQILDYVKKHVNLIQGAIIVIAINGMVVGALSLDNQKLAEQQYNDTNISKEIENIRDVEKDKEAEKTDEIKKEDNTTFTEEVEKAENGEKENNKEVKSQTVVVENKEEKKDVISSTNNTKPATSNTTVSSKVDTAPKKDAGTTQPTINNKEDVKEENVKNESAKEEIAKEESTVSKYYIKLNSGGIVQNMELEEYIVGVVAAEMPASFNTEALKAQAIAARTYAVKKTSQGKTLVNSTADQVYKTTSQMKSTWGSQYNYYYNRVKSAVDATRGLVLKYNGEYIDAQYSAMTNGKTELPEYVWSFSRPYLQCVSSSWDEQVKNFKVTKSFSYDAVSKALGQNISKDTTIEVLKRTVSGRVETIKIGEKTYTGVEVRSSLGLRSTDFTIELGDTVNITTKGYGHGVGMSQYGANVAANGGYTYSQILSHYYVGTVVTNI